jgi:hypothetical protein
MIRRAEHGSSRHVDATQAQPERQRVTNAQWTCGARPRAAPLACTHCCHRARGAVRLVAAACSPATQRLRTRRRNNLPGSHHGPDRRPDKSDQPYGCADPAHDRKCSADQGARRRLDDDRGSRAPALSAMRLYSNSFQAVPIVVPIFTSATGTPRTASRYAANAANAHDHSSPLGDRPSRDVRTSGAPPTALFAWRWRCGSHRMSWTLRPTGRCCQAARGSPC